MQASNMNMRPNKWLIILAIGIMHTAINIDFTAVNLAVAPIVKQFHASLTTAQWIINSYLLGSICLMIASGKIADMVGKRKIFLWGATIFTIASGLAGVAINQEWLITARFLQGIAVAIIFPVAMSIAFTSFPQKQRGLAMAIMLTIGGLAQSFGPVFGGIMVHFASWRWIFLINVPLGLFSIIATSILYPADNITTPEQSIDYRGIILIATALLLLSFGLNEIEQLGINSILLWSSLGAGAVLLLILGWHANQTANPIIELNCFKNRKFSTILIIRILIGYCWLALLFPIGLYLQNVLGYSALYAGLVLLAMSLMFGTLSPLAGKLIDRVGSKIPLIIGISLAIISFICFMQLPTNIGWQNLIMPLMLFGLGTGIMIPASATAALHIFPVEKNGAISGIYYTLAFFSGAIGVAGTGVLLATFNKAKMHQLLAEQHINLTQIQTNFANHVVTGTNSIHNLPQYFNASLTKQLIPIIHNAFSYGFTIAMGVCVGLLTLSLLLTVTMIKGDRSAS